MKRFPLPENDMHARRDRLGLATACFGLLVLAACAGARVQDSRLQVGPDELHPPPVVLVYDFAVDPNDVLVDSFGAGFGESDVMDRDKHGRESPERSPITWSPSCSRAASARGGHRPTSIPRSTPCFCKASS